MCCYTIHSVAVKSGVQMPRFEPGAAGWEACHANPSLKRYSFDIGQFMVKAPFGHWWWSCNHGRAIYWKSSGWLYFPLMWVWILAKPAFALAFASLIYTFLTNTKWRSMDCVELWPPTGVTSRGGIFSQSNGSGTATSFEDLRRGNSCASDHLLGYANLYHSNF